METCSQHQNIFAAIEVIKAKQDIILERFNTVIDETAKINNRCLEHLVERKEFADHIKESRENKSIWSDRRFRIVLLIATFSQTALFALFKMIFK